MTTLAAELRRIWAYIKKEFLIGLSYRFGFLTGLFGVFTSVTTFFFVDRMFGRQITPELAPFGATYFTYALVGNAFFAYVGTAIGGIAGRIRAEQMWGTLEVILGTPTRLWVLILAVAAWNTLSASVEVVMSFLVGGIGFGVDFSQINWLSLASILLLVIVAFNALGLIEAACLLVFKRGTVGAWMLNGLTALGGGVFFPVTVFPAWVQRVAEWIPITHAVRGLQLAIYQGTPISGLRRELVMLIAFCGLLAPLAGYGWNWALRRAKLDGSLSHH